MTLVVNSIFTVVILSSLKLFYLLYAFCWCMQASKAFVERFEPQEKSSEVKFTFICMVNVACCGG